jgi:ATP-dependent helicase IRC3
MSAPQLRPYQLDALNAIVEGMGGGQNRLLIKKPTGTGKTVMFAAMLKHPPLKEWLDGFDAGTRKMLVVAHREELLDQAAAKIMAQNPHARVSIEQADRYASPHSDVVIASIQTLTSTKCRRLKRLMARHQFRIVIVDEAHHAAAPTYRTALAHLGFLPMADVSDSTDAEAATYDDVAEMEAALQGWDARAPRDRVLVGVTATPNRSDAIGLGCVFQTIAYSYELKQAIADGWLVPIVPWVIESTASLDEVRINRGEFNQRELADTVNTEYRNKLALAGWQQYASDRSTLAFTVDVAHAHALAQTFADAGIKALPLSGETPKDDRRIMLRQFLEGSIQVITNCMVLTEGTDLPLTGCILHAKPTKSATLYEQMTGRGLRIHPGKTDCIVLDVVDVARKHSLQTAPVLYGLPPGLKANGKDLAEAENLIAEFMEKHPGADLSHLGKFTLDQLNAHAKTFDIWTVREMEEYGQGLAMRWTRTDDEAFRLNYPWQGGKEAISIERNLLGAFDVVSVYSVVGTDHKTHTGSRKMLATGVQNAHAALLLAEQFVATNRRSAAKLKDANASWRSGAPSEKQLAALRRRRIPFKPNITKGEASDLLDLAFSRKG